MKKISIYLIIFAFSLASISACKESNPSEPHHDHFEANGLVLLKNGAPAMTYFKATVYDTLFVQSGIEDIYEVMFLDKDSTRIEPPHDEDKTLGWQISDTTMLQVTSRLNHKWEIIFFGKKPGNTDVELQILHFDHPDFRTSRIPVSVK